MSTKDGRGFNQYGTVTGRRGATVRVKESSIAFEGAHVWLFVENPNLTQERSSALELSVSNAKELIYFLQEFISNAEGDELTESA